MNTAHGSRPASAGGRPVPLWALALPLLFVLLVTAAGIAVVTRGRPADTVWVASGQARVGGAAPGFTSWDLGGKKVGLSDFHGRAVLITFWATWCTVCRDEMPALQAMRDLYAPHGFGVLAVNYRETSTDRMRQYLAAVGVNLEAVIDPDGAIASAYRVDIGLPVNVLIDSSGMVARMFIGDTPTAAVRAAIADVVAA